MLHPTELPDCADLLEKVLDFEERLLALGCRMPTITPDDFRTELGSEVFNWLQSSKSTRKLFEPIYVFAKLSETEKEAILADFRHDRSYSGNSDSAAFQFRLKGDSNDPNRSPIRAWLVSFYEQFSTRVGIDGSCLGVGAVRSVGKSVWWDAFLAKNRKRFTCSACDGTMNHGMTVEHFLPKGKYPALSLHPNNLLPLCDKCNNDYKGEKDPLDGHDLATIFLPYRDNVRSSAQVELSDNGDGSETIRLAPRSPGSVVDVQLQGFADLFNIPGQWQANIHEISDIAWRQLRDYVAAVQDEGVVVKKDDMHTKLSRLCQRMESDWGTAHYHFPATEWLRWAGGSKYDHLCSELGIGS